jgi:SAM-dependent methyltransferase
VQSPYDSFAWFYDRYWAAPFQQWQRPALDRLLFPGLSAGARILDLCCGTGQLSRQLASKGYRVTGLDSSREMLRAARRNAPECTFLHTDAAGFTLGEPVDAVVCTFDSLNHLLEPDSVTGAFRSVYAVLKPSGHFVFDVNTGAAYGPQWDRSACHVAPDHAFFLRGGFDPANRVGTTSITMFRFLGAWRRFDVEVLQRPWEVSEIEAMLASTGFVNVRPHTAMSDLRMEGHYGHGRVYFIACRNSKEPGGSQLS